MRDNGKVYVSIYCKIYTDSFSDELVDQMATGDEIYAFLIRDAGLCFEDDGEPVPGDHNLWYLGCNEKQGHLIMDDQVINWGFGESSFDHVEAFVTAIYEKDIISKQQYQDLMNKIEEGRLIDNMYLIRDYLVCKREGIAWVKPDNDTFRDEIKGMLDGLKRSFNEKGYKFYTT
jgi:hypothetical protein